MIKQKDNGLELKSVKSKVMSRETISAAELKNFLEKFIVQHFSKLEGNAVFYFDFGIHLAKIDKGHLHFYNLKSIEAQFLQDARIFNLNQELHLWRTEADFSFRFRVDDEKGAVCQVIDVQQNLWGTTAEPLRTGWTRLSEERGTQVIVPLEIKSEINNPVPLAFLKTRNYIGFMDNHQATYIDNRFVELKRQIVNSKE